jgi:hypothetical protein
MVIQLKINITSKTRVAKKTLIINRLKNLIIKSILFLGRVVVVLHACVNLLKPRLNLQRKKELYD